MKLNHLNLTVTDVRAASDFLERYFGLRSAGGNSGMGFLTDNGGGFLLSLMKAREVAYPNTFHIGFFVGSRETVDEVNRRLQEDGFDVPATGGNWPQLWLLCRGSRWIYRRVGRVILRKPLDRWSGRTMLTADQRPVIFSYSASARPLAAEAWKGKTPLT